MTPLSALFRPFLHSLFQTFLSDGGSVRTETVLRPAGWVWRFAAALACGAIFSVVIAPAQETDKRIHSDGGPWRFEPAPTRTPGRPRVLLIGDSILNGYLAQTVKRLDGLADVDAWVQPYHQASAGLDRKIAEILSHGPYDVIHINMGLHGWTPGRIPAGQFEPLTAALIGALRQGAPRAKLIWASSTPVTIKGHPGALDPEINPIVVDHNRRAAGIMVMQGVPINDLYAVLVSRLELTRGDQFHWQEPAYELLAEAVAGSVASALPRPPAKF